MDGDFNWNLQAADITITKSVKCRHFYLARVKYYLHLTISSQILMLDTANNNNYL